MKITRISASLPNKNAVNKHASFKSETDSKIDDVDKKAEKLEKQGILPPFSYIIANLEAPRYNRAMQLIKKGVDYTCVENITSLDDIKYNQALRLVKEGIFDFYLFDIAKLGAENFQKAINYKSLGLNNDCLEIFAQLTDEELSTAKKLMQDLQFPPIVAGNLAKLSDEQKNIAMSLLDETEIEIACAIARMDDNKQRRCKSYLNLGINQHYAVDIVDLNETEEKRIPELLKLGIDDKNIFDFAKLSEEHFSKAKELLAIGVEQNEICSILEIEEDDGENEDYTFYRSNTNTDI